MTRRHVCITGWVGLALVLLPCLVAAQQPRKSRAERPVYEAGDQWVLKDGVYDLIRTEKDVYVFAASADRQIHLTKDLVIAKVVRGGRVVWQLDPPPALSWPLEAGKWGSRSATLRIDSVAYGAMMGCGALGVASPVRVTWQVKSYDDVRVVAGVVKAFNIVFSIDLETAVLGSRPSACPVHWDLTLWYAPEAKRLVRIDGSVFAGTRGLDVAGMEVVSLGRPGGVSAPLEVRVDDPPDQARVTADRVTVRGRVTSGAGVARVTATVNGAEVRAYDQDPKQKEVVSLGFPVELQEGRNVLLVTAVDVNGRQQQERRVVFRERAPAPSTAAPPPTGPPAATAAPPLQIAVSSPADQTRVTQETIPLSGLVSGRRGVSRVVVTLNGIEVARQEHPVPAGTVPVNVPLKLRDGQNMVVVTASDADGTTQQEARTVYWERVMPLAVQIRHPEDGARVTEEVSLLAALITSSAGVAAVEVSLNGAPVSVPRDDQRAAVTPKSVAVTVPLTLRAGTNVILVSAREPDGTVRHEMRTVIFERPPGPTVPPAAPPPVKRERWAVVIGVSVYESRGIPPLQFSVRDAETVSGVLVNQAGFPKEHVLLLTDKTEKKPTLRNLKWALGTFLARSAKKDDLVVVFFAGHGAPEVDPRGVESDGLSKYLVPIDADSDDLYSTALPMDEFQTLFDRIEAEQVVVLIDACYSGAAGGRTFASRRTRASRVDDLFLERLTRSKGRAILTASRSAEVSLELPELGHGLFTHYLVQGLRGAADLDRDGIVTLQELYQYVEQQVSARSRTLGGNQHPVLKGEVEGVLPLVRVGGREAAGGSR